MEVVINILEISKTIKNMAKVFLNLIVIWELNMMVNGNMTLKMVMVYKLGVMVVNLVNLKEISNKIKNMAKVLKKRKESYIIKVTVRGPNSKSNSVAFFYKIREKCVKPLE